MKKRTVYVSMFFDMEEIPDEFVTPKDRVKEMIEKDMHEYCYQDEGYLGVEVQVIDE